MTDDATDLLGDAQAGIGRALESARAGEDRALAQQVRESGEQFVRLMTGLLRLTHIHSPDNHAFDQPTGDLASTMVRLERLLGQIQLVCVEGQIYVNDIRIRMDDRMGGHAELGVDLARHSCGGLQFQRPLEGSELRKLIDILSRAPSAERPLTALQDGLKAAGLESISANGLYRLRLTGETAVAREDKELRQTLDRAAGLVADAWDNMSASRVPNPLPIRRMVNDIVDAAASVDLFKEEEEAMFSGSESSPHARHSLRVCTVSVMIGREVGLSSAQLADLGVAAMYHDVGYAAREDGFAPPFERHGTAGARLLLKQRGFHQAKLKRMLTAIEHHRPFGWMNPGGEYRRPTLYARIVRIAEDFDTYTRARAGGAIYGPAEALARMATLSGSVYDPQLFQLFVNRIGPFPPGTVLKLRDGRVVVSVSGARDKARFSRPLCRIVHRADGSSPEEAIEVDLALEGAISEVMLARGR